ncbi:Ig-like domain-containing protein [Gemmatimonas sp.]|uniref:Ig-like domain-containing protein n=1 Tax=Gemmatimonas sp. TaxID=1962908 RepID=UPI00286A9BC0|nr:Ig-like domain-containing protein [Gemmatimonas sp.]
MHALLVASVSTAPLACGGESSTTPSSGAISTITLSPQTLTLGVGSSVALDVSVRNADGQPTNPRTIFWSSSDAAIARVSAAGLVTALAPGSVQISATVEGKSAVANVAVAPTSVASVQLSSVELRLTTGQRVQLTASARDASGAPLSGRVVTWTVSDASIAVVDSTGALTALAPGGTTVTAASEGRTATAAVFVTSVPVATVVLTPSSTSIVEGQTTQLRVETRSSTGVVLSGRTIAWSSSNASVASVSSSGLVTGVAMGTTTITASSEGRSGSASVTITARPVNAIVVSPSQLSLIAGQAVALTVQITDAQGNLLSGRPVSYRSDSVGVASVSANGAVTAVAPGSATITVTSEGRSATVRVVVSAVPISSIRVTPSLATLTVGDDTALTAVTLDASGAALSGRVIAWSSGSPSVATVSTSGLVTAVGVGSVIILAQAEGRTGSATITVNAPPIAVVTVAPSTVSVDVGGTVDLAATVNDATGATVFGRVVLWSSSVPSVATVSSTGRVTAVAAGTSTVTATVDGKSGTAQITVSPTPIGTVTVAPTSSTLAIGGTTDLVATVRDVNGVVVTGRSVAWTTSAASVATVSSTGRVSAVAAGTSTVTATVDGRSGTAQITVTPTPIGTVTVAPASRTLDVGGTVDLVATVLDVNGVAVSGRTVTWSSSAIAVAAVSSTGRVTALVPGTATITATVDGKSGTAQILVSTPAVQTVGRVTVSPASATIKSTGPSDRTVQLNAVVYADSASGGSALTNAIVVWSSNAPLIATVSITGLVTAISEGTAIISATSGTKSGTSTITVVKR